MKKFFTADLFRKRTEAVHSVRSLRTRKKGFYLFAAEPKVAFKKKVKHRD
jgi:hypothetical protein